MIRRSSRATATGSNGASAQHQPAGFRRRDRVGASAAALASNLALAMGSVLVALILVEVALRLGGDLGARAKVYPQVTSERLLARPSPVGLPRFQPIRTRWNTPEFTGSVTINSGGFRGAELPVPGEKTPNEKRILVLGDSFVFGWGVDDSLTMPVYLARLLNAEPSPFTFRVLNLGIPIYGPGREALLLEHEGLALEPDLVVSVFTESNDVLDDAVFARNPLGPPEGKQMFFWDRTRLGRLLWARVGGLSRWAETVRTSNVDRTIGYLGRLSAICTEHGVPLIVVLFISKAQQTDSGRATVMKMLHVDERLHQRVLWHLQQDPGVRAVADLAPLLARGDSLYFRVEGHPTPAAYRTCAAAIAPMIRAVWQ